MALRPIQAQALYEFASLRGGFGPIGVGHGKTLITALIPYLLQSRRPLLLTRASLIEKTKREFRALAFHWPILNYIRLMSYESLGRANHKDDLELFCPDVLICDEGHRLKNPKAAVTKRVARFMNARPQTTFIVLSGTLTGRTLRNYAHLLKWALKAEHFPLPDHYTEIEDWAEVLDTRTISSGGVPAMPGALMLLCTPEERISEDPTLAVRAAYKRRLTETPGVVSTGEGALGCSLMVQNLEIAVSPKVDDAFQVLRYTWTTPDGWPISEPMTLWRHARELALGFYYRWDPRPPDSWLLPRKDWAAWCRKILTENRRNLDSELQVVNAVDAGFYPDAKHALDEWRRVKPSFVPNTVPVWIDDSVLNACARWAHEHPGIVWCEHVAFAEALAKKTNLSYYGRGGLDSQGNDVERHPPDQSLIASMGSVGEGRNLQAWCRNLITSCPTSGIQAEQVLGRTHRPGQLADEVTFDVLTTSIEHVLAFEQARRDAREEEQRTGLSQRLNFADIVFPTVEEICMTHRGPRWIK